MSDALKPLRAWMQQDGIDVMLFPHNDQFQSEYLPTHDNRLAWLSGFTGSWGYAIITQEQAILFIDGRYTLQAPQQVDTTQWTIVEALQQRPTQWLSEHLQKDQIVALEGWRFTVTGLQQFQAAITRKKAVLRQMDGDIADFLWADRPTPAVAPAFLHDIRFAGKSRAEKIIDLQIYMSREHLDGYLITDPGHVCWLLNLRGRDVAHTPILLSMAFVAANGHVSLFTLPDKIGVDLLQDFGDEIAVYGFNTMQTVLVEHLAEVIGVDPGHAPSILTQALQNAGKEIVPLTSPIELARAIKNEIEIIGSRNAHRRDAVAEIETMHWLQTHPEVLSLTEQHVIDYLRNQRAAQDLYVEDSFGAIAGAGPHGAFVHYSITAGDDITLKNDSLLLLDGGGQYHDGTTDITRTFAIGTPSAHMIADYTSVLQAHIALTLARFPVGVTGAALDTLARAKVWQQGRHYTHGTGHGIGSFMGVHEGPQGFSPRSPAPLAAGMLITNEPGYYKKDAYGIRLENVVLVVDMTHETDDQPMLGFEALTLVPFESNLIDFNRLSVDEKNWLRDYHQQVVEQIGSLLREELQGWLRNKVAVFL